MPNSVEFWSSTEYATFLPALVRALGGRGWDARARFAVREDAYRRAKGRAARLVLRARAYGLYPLALAAAVRSRRRPDVAVVSTNTFYAPWVAQRAAPRGGEPVVHWVFDLFPDVLILADVLRGGSLAERWLRRCVRATFDRAAANVFLGERLRAYAESRFGPIPRSAVIPVGCDASPFAESPPGPRPPGAPVRILYCGNFGRMHEVDSVAAALRGGVPDALELEFRGNGVGFRALQAALAGAGRVRMGGNLPEPEWVEAMRRADVALVTMRAGAAGLVMPSKAYSAMAAGQAVLAVCPGASDLADTVRGADCGWVVEPGDGARLAGALREIAAQPGEILRRRSNAWRAAREHFDQPALADAWAGVLEGARAAGLTRR